MLQLLRMNEYVEWLENIHTHTCTQNQTTETKVDIWFLKMFFLNHSVFLAVFLSCMWKDASWNAYIFQLRHIYVPLLVSLPFYHSSTWIYWIFLLYRFVWRYVITWMDERRWTGTDKKYCTKHKKKDIKLWFMHSLCLCEYVCDASHKQLEKCLFVVSCM